MSRLSLFTRTWHDVLETAGGDRSLTREGAGCSELEHLRAVAVEIEGALAEVWRLLEALKQAIDEFDLLLHAARDARQSNAALRTLRVLP